MGFLVAGLFSLPQFTILLLGRYLINSWFVLLPFSTMPPSLQSPRVVDHKSNLGLLTPSQALGVSEEPEAGHVGICVVVTLKTVVTVVPASRAQSFTHSMSRVQAYSTLAQVILPKNSISRANAPSKIL